MVDTLSVLIAAVAGVVVIRGLRHQPHRTRARVPRPWRFEPAGFGSQGPAAVVRAVVLAVAAGAFSCASFAQSYGVMSLVGSQITVVTYRAPTGSHTDANLQQAYDVGDATIDRMALDAVVSVLNARSPDAKVPRLSAGDKAWIVAVRTAAVDGSSELDKLLEPVIDAAQKGGVARLVLVLPARTDLRMKIQQGVMGSGRAAGVGLYLDPNLRLRRPETGDSMRGSLGVFANFKLVLIDTATRRAQGEVVLGEGALFSGARSQDANPVNALSTEEKLAAFNHLLRAGIERELPPLLERAGR
jgi:hypothetical protein